MDCIQSNRGDGMRCSKVGWRMRVSSIVWRIPCQRSAGADWMVLSCKVELGGA